MGLCEDDARRYYGSLWYRENDTLKWRDVASERNLQATAADDEANQDDHEEEVNAGEGEGGLDVASGEEDGNEDGAPAEDDDGGAPEAGAAGPPRPTVAGKGPARPTVGGKDPARVEQQRLQWEAAANQGNENNSGAGSRGGRPSSGGSDSLAQRPRLGGKRPPGQQANQSAADTATNVRPMTPLQRPQRGAKRPPQATKPAADATASPSNGNPDPDDEAESEDSESSVRSDLVANELSYGHDGDAKRFKQFILEHPPFTDTELWEGGWMVPGTYLDSGSYGILFVYRKLENGRFIDRVAVKDCIVHSAFWTAFESVRIDLACGVERVHYSVQELTTRIVAWRRARS